MAEDSNYRKNSGLARRLFKAVGQAGTAVGGVAGDILRSAGRGAKNASGRAALTFSKNVELSPQKSLREIAESLTGWLVTEHRGKAELQQQKPSTVELNELGLVQNFYEVSLEEPGLAGRQFYFVIRSTPLRDVLSNFPNEAVENERRALIVLDWPQDYLEEPNGVAVAVWNQACYLGERNPAMDLLQRWLSDELGGTFPNKPLHPAGIAKKTPSVPILGREEELNKAARILLTSQPRVKTRKSILSLAAPGGTGKSFYLKALRSRCGAQIRWAGVDHQGIVEDSSATELLGRILTQMAQELESQGLVLERFRKELHDFRKRLQSDGSSEPSGFFGHLRKAAETAAGINPVLGALSAGVVFFTSWGQEQKDESEALAKDNAVVSLTNAFKADLVEYGEKARERSLVWPRPVLVFDTYEWIAPLIDTWVRTEFIADNFLEESQVVLILSGREHLLRTDTRWSEWQYLITNISLGPFDKTTTAEYLATLEVDASRHDELYKFTEGLPLFLSLAAQIQDADQAVEILAERVLEEVPEAYREHFKRASLLDNFDARSIERLWESEDEADLEMVSKLLNKATFTVAQGGKRCFLGPVQRILQRALVLELSENVVQELKSRLS